MTTPTAIPAIAPLLRPDDELAVLDGVAICVAADVMVGDEVADVVDIVEDVVVDVVFEVDVDDEDVVAVAAANDEDQAAAALWPQVVGLCVVLWATLKKQLRYSTELPSSKLNWP
jgi:hypothetical protein